MYYKNVVIPLLQSLMEIIMFKDYKSSNKSINILIRILPELVKIPELYEIIGDNILKTALMVKFIYIYIINMTILYINYNNLNK